MKISVCIATYNGKDYIAEQISSILPQLSTTDEIIVSDNGSTDSTLNILKSFKDSRIKIINNNSKEEKTPHVRISKNFERALTTASGDFIFLSDQDDIWKKNKVKEIKNNLNNYSLVISNAAILSKKNSVIMNSFYKKSPITGIFKKLYKIKYHGCTMAFTREVLESALPFPEKLETHDAWIGLIAELTGHVKYINKNLIYYRIHGGNASTNTHKNLSEKISYRIYLFKELYWRYKRISTHKKILDFFIRLQKNER